MNLNQTRLFDDKLLLLVLAPLSDVGIDINHIINGLRMTTIHRIETRTPFPIDRVNCYYIRDSAPTLIDAGVNTDESFDEVESAIRKAGGTVEGLKKIILTHAHSDHIGLVARIVELSGSEVYIHKWDASKMADDGESGFIERIDRFRRFFLQTGVPESVIEKTLSSIFDRFRLFYSGFSGVKPLEGGEIFSFDDFCLEVIHTPGHTPGSICLFDRENGTFLSGDTLLEKISSNPLVEVGSLAEEVDYRSLEQFMSSLHVIEALPVIKVLPGHGGPFSDHRKRVGELFTHHEDRINQVFNILKDNEAPLGTGSGMTLFSVASAIFGRLEGIDLFLGLSEAKCHLEVLEKKGLVLSQKQGILKVYFLENSPGKSVRDIVSA